MAMPVMPPPATNALRLLVGTFSSLRSRHVRDRLRAAHSLWDLPSLGVVHRFVVCAGSGSTSGGHRTPTRPSVDVRLSNESAAFDDLLLLPVPNRVRGKGLCGVQRGTLEFLAFVGAHCIRKGSARRARAQRSTAGESPPASQRRSPGGARASGVVGGAPARAPDSPATERRAAA